MTTPYDSLYSAPIPVTGPARLYVRVTDNDRTPGHDDLDAINIDYMCIEVDGAPLAPDTILVQNVAVAQAGSVSDGFYAVASVLIHDQFDNPMGGVHVTGHFEGPTTNLVTGTTGVDGRVDLLSDKSGAPEGVWSFRINTVDAPGLAFNPSLSLSFGSDVAVSGIPQAYILSQNYPNPFNPSTNISLWLPNRGRAVIKVYDITGRELGVLFEGTLDAGNHVFTWDAGSYASGIYFFLRRKRPRC